MSTSCTGDLRNPVLTMRMKSSRVRAMPRDGQRVLTFSLQDASADFGLTGGPEPALACRGEPLLPLAALRLQGEHNAANALAALAMCEALGLARAPVLDALAEGVRQRRVKAAVSG